MIPIIDIFDRVQDLSRKDRSGYMNSDEVTRDVNQSQDILMQYYFMRFEQTQMIVDSLMPFIKQVQLPIIEDPLGNYADFPDDYRYRIEAGYNIIENQAEDCDIKDPKVEPILMSYLHTNEVLLTESSAIRKPSHKRGNYYHHFANNKINILPRDSKGTISFKYITAPPRAVYATLINSATDKEDYDPANSIDLEWLEQDFHNIVDIMLLFKGIQTRETALIQWVQQKKVISNAP